MLFKCLVVGGLLVESYLLYNAIGKAKPDCAVLFSLGVGDIHACVAQPVALGLVRLAEDLLHDSLGFVSVMASMDLVFTAAVQARVLPTGLAGMVDVVGAVIVPLDVSPPLLAM